MLGKLTIDALPFYSGIAMGGALITVFGALGVVALITWLGQWRYLWTEWLTSLDHKKIGIMYVTLALIMLVRGFIDALMMRTQQAVALDSHGYLPPDHFDQIFTSHATIMVFFVAMPFLVGLFNVVVPQQIGARDVAFPFMNSVSLWLTASGAALVMISLVIGKFSTAGWNAYPPYSEAQFSPGVGVDYWIWAILVSGVGSMLTGINFLVTIVKRRAPGMRLMMMPLFTWSALCTSILIVFAFPALTVAAALLGLDRYLGMHFFTNGDGGNATNYINLFWIWGHPEVYILLLPAFGVYSEVVATFSGKRLFGYESLVYATAVTAVLSLTVWLHHFFTMGANPDVNAFFGRVAPLIAVPTGVTIFDWLFTMYRGRVQFSVPMLFTLGFIVTFVIGGMTGVLLAVAPGRLSDAQYNLPGGAFPQHDDPRRAVRLFRRLPVLVPQGVRLSARGKMGPAGLLGLDRRLLSGLRAALYSRLHGHAAAPRALLCRRLAAVSHRSRIRRPLHPVWHHLPRHSARRQHPRPRRACSLDRRSVERQDAGMGDRLAAGGLQFRRRATRARHRCMVGHEAGGDGGPHRPARFHDIIMPDDSSAGVVLGAMSFVFAFAMVWQIWWLAAVGGLGMFAAVLSQTFRDHAEHRIPASEVEAIENRRTMAAALAPGAPT